MLAWTTDPDAPGGLALADVPEPAPAPHEAVVRIDAFAPNPGDLAGLAAAAPGSVPGWDGSGVVLAAAADGSGPPAGTPVLVLGMAGGWARRRAVSTAMIGSGPAGAPAERLATLPVPGGSALRAVRSLGSVLGRRVLVSGATSAVGRFAVQLAARSGAHVVAVARDTARHEELRRLGARETHTEPRTVVDAVHGAIDLIGGRHLVDAFALLGPGGTVISLGHAAGTEDVFPAGAFLGDPRTADRTIRTFFLASEPGLAAELTLLAADATLDAGPLDVRPWTELGAWTAAGAPRRAGRAVFLVDHPQDG